MFRIGLDHYEVSLNLRSEISCYPEELLSGLVDFGRGRIFFRYSRFRYHSYFVKLCVVMFLLVEGSGKEYH